MRLANNFQPREAPAQEVSAHKVRAACPACGASMPSYRLLPDFYGVKHFTDVSWAPCAECLSTFSPDDGK